MTSFKPKELRKGGKPAQVKGAYEIALEENKTFLKTLFSGAAAPLIVTRIKAVGIAPEKSQASAGLATYGGSRMTNTVVQFGTAVDYLLETETGCIVLVPSRFLNNKGSIHQDLFKVGDAIVTTGGSCTKEVNIGLRSGRMAVGERRWLEVAAWVPAEKLERALKEKRVCLHNPEEAMQTATAAMREAEERVAAARAADLAEMARLSAEAAAGGCDPEIGNWY
jgi:hypothetical protein